MNSTLKPALLTSAKSFRLVSLLVLTVCGLISCSQTKTPGRVWTKENPFRIALLNPGGPGPYKEIVDGFREQLKTEVGDTATISVDKDANGDPTAFSTMVSTAISTGGLNLIAPISTPITNIAMKLHPSGVSICFLGVTDPLKDKIVESFAKPVFSTGVVDLPPFDRILKLIRTLYPAAHKLAFPYTGDDSPAIYSRDQVVKLGPQYGFSVSDAVVPSADEGGAIFQQLIRTNDAILIGQDNKMFGRATNIAKIATDSRKPFFGSDSSTMQLGALGGYSVNYRVVGQDGARLAVRIMRGEKAGDIPVRLLTDGNLEFNGTAIKELNVNISDDLRRRAKIIWP